MTRFYRWTVHLVRKDGLESHTLNLGAGRMTLTLAIITIVLLGLGVAAGLYWAGRTESETIASLRGEIAVLQGERAQVVDLAGRLEEMEAGYERLQAAVTGGRPAPPTGEPLSVAGPGGLATGEEPEATSLAWPLAQRGFVTRTFGSRAAGGRGGHPGVDIAVPTGSYVRAIRSGRVEEAGQDSIYGLFVRIAHADGLTSLYGHNSWLFVSSTATSVTPSSPDPDGASNSNSGAVASDWAASGLGSDVEDSASVGG
ncbi:MAG: peptidoglycan DD-metalloendopeptidase family protein, partial [Gemmatimonadetes bacterium]|nr:peptidoglycan DD-metalloendopeptidase family protein [Gemmatimonadota bacterium]